MNDQLKVLELTAWKSDFAMHSEDCMQQPEGPIILRPETEQLRPLFASLLNRNDLQQEFVGLNWRIAVVDLGTLHAFQRRLVFDPCQPATPAPVADDWPALIRLAFGPPRSTAHEYIGPDTIRSENPDLHLRDTDDGWQLHGGSPFFEVALYQGRAFLRDGYHRAYALLAAGVYAIPAVVIDARSMSEVYYASPNFFPESILFSQRPPMVTDFTKPSLTSCRSTSRIFKTIHLPPHLNLIVSEQTKEFHP